MARQVLPVAGAIVGWFVGGGPQGRALGPALGARIGDARPPEMIAQITTAIGREGENDELPAADAAFRNGQGPKLNTKACRS